MEFVAIAAVVVGLFLLQNKLYKTYAFKNLEYSCTLSTNECYEGDEIELVEEIVNKKWLPLPLALLRRGPVGGHRLHPVCPQLLLGQGVLEGHPPLEGQMPQTGGVRD